MTAPLYVRDGSRFVLYSPQAQHVPPIPVPQLVDDGPDERIQYTAVHAARCRHGHFRGCSRCGPGDYR